MFDLAAVAVTLDAGAAGVDDEMDARNGQRGFRNIGCKHNAWPVLRLEDALLLGLRQARKQRQDLGLAMQRMVTEVSAQMVGHFADFPLARQENQDVAARAAAWPAPEFVNAVGNGLRQAMLTCFLERAIAHLHRKHPARHLKHRRRPPGLREVPGKAISVNRGRGHDDAQIGPPRQDAFDVTEKKVNVQAAFMRLVNDQRVVGPQQRVRLGFGQQNAVGHELDRGLARQPVLEAHLVAHHLARCAAQFLRHPLGDAGCSDASWLRMPDQTAQAGRLIQPSPPQRQGNLRQLGGLARAGFAADDDDLVLPHRRGNLVAPGRHRQALGERDVQRQRLRQTGFPGARPSV